jgi:opacity protein-like surface antigen
VRRGPSRGLQLDLLLKLPRQADHVHGCSERAAADYLGAGPAWAFTEKSDDLALVLGGLVRAGVAVQVFRHLALFAEYRYSFFPGFELQDRGLTFKTDLDTHHVVGGLSFRF